MRIWEILAFCKKSCGFEKSLLFAKNHADLRNPCVSQKNRQTMESLRASKSPHLLKNQRFEEKHTAWRKTRGTGEAGGRLLFRLGGISSCWLPPGLAEEWRALVQILVDVMNLSCSPQVRRWLRLPCFYVRPFPVLYRLLVPARHANEWPKSTRKPKSQAAAWNFTNSCQITKILSQLKSVLSLSRKIVHDYCCCPVSAVILKTSKLEAILKIWRGCWKLSQWGRGVGGTSCGRLSSCAGCGSASSLRLHAWWHHSLLLFQCLFLPFHLSLYRGKLGGSR